MTFVVTVMLALLLLITVLRVEHIVASDIWILHRGAQFRRSLDSLRRRKKGRSRLSDPTMRWKIYQECGGWKLPWLFFGIQSTRLLAWSDTVGGIGPQLLFRLIRGVWRFYTFAPVVAIAITLMTWLTVTRRAVDAWLALMIIATLVVGCIGIAVGGVLASMRIGAFARYHHFGWPPPEKPEDLRHRELSLVIGSALIALLAMTALLFLISSRFHGFDYSADDASPFLQLWRAMFTALLGILGQASSEPQNGFGAFGIAAAALTQISYVVILSAATHKTWGQ